jgi:hypothetical protein
MPYEPHPHCSLPESDEILMWRYMDLSRFLWVLEHASLFFCRLGRFEDTFEGALPTCVVPAVVAANEAWYDPKTNFDQTLPERIVDATRNVTFVNCWHANAHESAAMWKLYGGADGGIAIQSTYGRLKTSFEGYSGRVSIGLVRYIDFSRELVDPYSTIALATTKRKSFEHERELRILASPDPNDPNVDREKLGRGLRIAESLVIPVNLDKLIERVYVSPAAPGWFGNLIASLMLRFGKSQEVIHSDLYSRPML